jgi:hypothetical protein
VAQSIDSLPETHILPIVGKLLSAIQADNIRFGVAATEIDCLLLRKCGLSMLTAENKAEERRDHPDPKNKFTISIVQAKESKLLSSK